MILGVVDLVQMLFGNISVFIFQAETIPTSIIHSGWELKKFSKKTRHLVVMTLILSQVPVYMTAFGVLILSHHNFIMVSLRAWVVQTFTITIHSPPSLTAGYRPLIVCAIH